MLSLREAVRQRRLEEFIRQEEARGVGPVDPETFDAAIKALLKDGQSGDQTSGSQTSGDLTGR